ncbi:Bug family tripartite tricarboxylate transporter substrate binding protein [Limnohabitans sp.]|jgi:tripartite-type tricarboxylate transporter receptor subunit TctC|uniref:Bug family tripartite tricarboxylate transporter substrate binding protein n=1 Tax=Limnohabitans sp. TaxID=1907725 RepID=UPI0039BC581E|nr:tripartite tricarboxylate transporter substrate binding protein [Comamonadaceae bacterium]
MVLKFFIRLSVLWALGLAATTWAQGTYPQKPVTLIVPFPAGGIADLSARALKPSLDKALGQSVLIVNRPGASGAIGAAAVANANADGYTLMYTLSSVASVPEQAILNGQKAPFTLDQFVPVARVTVDVVSLVVRADSPYKTYQDFAAALRANPKGMTYSSSGNYGISHFPAEMLLAATQTEARHIPYAGGAPMLTALMGGQVDFNIPVRTLALPHVQSGRLRYLAMYGARRWAQAPDVPTLAELGVPIDFVPWTGLFAPAGTPAEVLATLRRALRAASQDSQFVETVGKSSAGEIAYLDGSELETFWKADLARTSVTIQRIGRIQ